MSKLDILTYGFAFVSDQGGSGTPPCPCYTSLDGGF